LKPPPWAQGLKPAGRSNPLGAPALPPPPGRPSAPPPPPGQLTQEDEASDDTLVPDPRLSPPGEADLPETSEETELPDTNGDTPGDEGPDRAASGD